MNVHAGVLRVTLALVQLYLLMVFSPLDGVLIWPHTHVSAFWGTHHVTQIFTQWSIIFLIYPSVTSVSIIMKRG